MRKWRFVLLSMIAVVMMSACSHKSDAELVDVEQFRCQDSIETVFDVLGETELKEYSYPSKLENGDMAYYERGYYIIFADIKDAGYYLYDKVNLFGFNGYLVFDVREDKETIQGIYCNLTLNDEEFNELVEGFEEKYGAYKEDNFGETIKTYEWIISEKNGKIGYGEDEIGYDEIVIENRGDDKYIVAFNDEWSFERNKYYEALEESQNPQSNWETMASQNYEYDGVTMDLTFSKDEEGLFHFSIGLNVEEKWKAAGIYTYVKLLVNVLNEQLEDKGISSFVTMICGDDVISSEVSFTANGEESELIDDGTWLIDGYQDENFDADECEQLWEQIEDDIYYFLMGDEYSKYKNN